ncbi:protein of unknown function [Xenorhabdus doucetiae]|uniref:Uncharacterized protein n=1 Tax=Xenorhabdus doucetiae TaxID=351671 RepID=A0A068QP49_9GAMM|nr:protein of unknown function [Xenorhabdus doucetiae]
MENTNYLTVIYQNELKSGYVKITYVWKLITKVFIKFIFKYIINP